MPGHMTTVGIPINNDSSLAHFATQAINQGDRITAGYGSYFRWDMGSGVQLWVQINTNDEIVGLNPHYDSDTTMRVGLTDRLRSNAVSAMDGSFYGWLSDDDNVQVPFVFDVPDFMVHQQLRLPAILPLQLCAFAHRLRAYRDAAEFKLAHHNDEVQFTTSTFVPTGLFTPDGAASPEPAAFAFLTGTVTSTMTRVNETTGLSFLWARVSTLGGKIDMVCDPDLCEGVLMRGSVIKGSFWLSGRLKI